MYLHADAENAERRVWVLRNRQGITQSTKLAKISASSLWSSCLRFYVDTSSLTWWIVSNAAAESHLMAHIPITMFTISPDMIAANKRLMTRIKWYPMIKGFHSWQLLPERDCLQLSKNLIVQNYGESEKVDPGTFHTSPVLRDAVEKLLHVAPCTVTSAVSASSRFRVYRSGQIMQVTTTCLAD